MFRNIKSGFALLIGIGVLLFISIAVVYAIDTHFSLNPWGDGDIEWLWYFLLGIIFFPGAFRRYRAGRQTEPRIPWHHRVDLMLCLLGLVFGLTFALSVVQKWINSLLMSGVVIDNRIFTVMAIVLSAVDLCWIVLFILLIYRAIKQSQLRKEDPPQAT